MKRTTLHLLSTMAFVASEWAFNMNCHAFTPEKLAPLPEDSYENVINLPSNVFQAWPAGTTVTLSQIKTYGEDKCFTSSPISDAIFARMRGKSFKNNCTTPRSALRYLKVVHYNSHGEPQLGEIVCNKLIANDLLSIFRKLFQARYPIERMVLVDEYNAIDTRSMEANNTSCFNFRLIKGTSKASKHGKGLAIDINPLYNPHVKQDKHGKLLVEPSCALPYADRKKPFRYKITKEDLCYKEFVKHGFRWGGAWKSSKDYQHFEK